MKKFSREFWVATLSVFVIAQVVWFEGMQNIKQNTASISASNTKASTLSKRANTPSSGMYSNPTSTARTQDEGLNSDTEEMGNQLQDLQLQSASAINSVKNSSN